MKSPLQTFTYKNPSTGKIENFNYRIPTTTPSPKIPIGGYPIKRVAKKAKRK